MVDVFISYPRAQRARAEPIKDKLEALDLDVFFDLEGIDGGDNFPDVIDQALRSSKAVLCAWSPLYFERPWCLIECRNAKARALLVPVTTEAFAPFAPPADLQGVNYYDLTRWSGEAAHEDWNRALRRVGQLVGRELAPELKRGVFGGVKAGAAPPTPSAAQARADLLDDLRRTWASFPAKDDPAVVERFLARVRAQAPGSGLEFEVEHHLELLERAAERAQREAAEAEAARRAEETRRRAQAEKAAEAARRAEEERRRALAARAKPGAVWRDRIQGLAADALPEMVTLPPGRFLMGAAKGEEGAYDDELPQHEVTIAHTLAMGRYPVTFVEWDAARTAGARLENPSDEGWGRDRRPVINVSWEDAQVYLEWLNTELGLGGRADAYRLPSEAEWEYACRAGTTTPFSFGETISTDQANYDGNFTYGRGKKGAYREKTTPAGSFPANAFGLHDMHGNVWEWCADPWHEDYKGAPTDGSAWTTGGDVSRRVLRGGSWYDTPRSLRSAYRDRRSPDFRGFNRGFRLARTVSP